MPEKSPIPPQETQFPLVEVVPLGQVNPTVVEVAAGNLQAVLELPAAVLPARPDPAEALLPERGQYDASRILPDLLPPEGPPPLRLGVLSGDLCLPFLTHVFGQAQLEGGAAVISPYRLGGSRLLERVAKVALHETAHMLGLVHCHGHRCLMNFTPSPEGLDQLDMLFCPDCQREFHWQRLRLLAKAPAGGAT